MTTDLGSFGFKDLEEFIEILETNGYEGKANEVKKEGLI